jgi:hypothetical protein
MNTGACDGLEYGDSGIDWRRELVRSYGHHRTRPAWKLSWKESIEVCFAPSIGWS